ncbi:MAG TPA: hypothetical protein VN861_02935 [Candidatus Acidoferrales bacterium]|nr:hypothetical protein [Candidatus Acidoferrales bacterium]
MNDREFLLWLRDRLIYRYGEDAGEDLVLRLEQIADKLAGQRTLPSAEQFKRWMDTLTDDQIRQITGLEIGR